MNERMRAGLAASGAHLDAIYYCLHHPQALVSELRETCRCRKPQPGLLLTAACDLQVDLATSYMVGDGMQDVEAGLAAGCKPILIRRPRSLKMKPPTVNGARVATSLLAAVKQILSEEGDP